MIPKANLHRQGGQGRDLLFIHGFGADRFSWAANAPGLTDTATVWTLDLPGHGGASNAVGQGDPATLAQAVAAELVALNGPAVVVGHSLGAAVALHLAAMVPEAVARLVLISPAGWGARLDFDFLTSFAELADPAEAQALLERLVARKRLIAPAMVAYVLQGLANPDRRAALRQVAAALLAAGPPTWPATIPVDLIWGALDDINPAPEDLAALGATSLLHLPNIGHMPQIEAAAKVGAVLRAALG